MEENTLAADRQTPPLPSPDASRQDASRPGASSSDVPGTDVPGTDVPGTDVPGTDVPGTDVPGTDVPGTDVPGTDVPGTDVPAPTTSFGRWKSILGSLPGTKPLMIVFEFFESCGITIGQLRKLAEGKANNGELNKTLTPIVFKTVPALQSALEYLEEQNADSRTGECFLVIRNVTTKSGQVQPYVFICTSNEQQQNVPITHFPYYKSAGFILETVEKHKNNQPSTGTDGTSSDG